MGFSVKKFGVVAIIACTLFVGFGETAQAVQGTFSGKDQKRKKIKIRLKTVARDLRQVTDIQPLPTDSDTLFVALKTGKIFAVSISRGTKRLVGQVSVRTRSEMGLLGLAFHPRFKVNHQLYLNYNPPGGSQTRVSEFKYSPRKRRIIRKSERRLFDLQQPYSNHNGGQLAFGPGGKLYIGIGDGGSAGDPHRHGQNQNTFLGSLSTYDVDAVKPKLKVFAFGLRNPWRFSFSPLGKLIVADVGQNQWEEVSIVEEGGNYGWAKKEGFHCFLPSQECEAGSVTPLIDPIYEYGREEGGSITGGYVATDAALGPLKGKYIFGDFVTGRIWAIEIPEKDQSGKYERVAEPIALGKWPLQISTFGRDLQGRIYVGDFTSGKVYQLRTKASPVRSGSTKGFRRKKPATPRTRQ